MDMQTPYTVVFLITHNFLIWLNFQNFFKLLRISSYHKSDFSFSFYCLMNSKQHEHLTILFLSWTLRDAQIYKSMKHSVQDRKRYLTKNGVEGFMCSGEKIIGKTNEKFVHLFTTTTFKLRKENLTRHRN